MAEFTAVHWLALGVMGFYASIAVGFLFSILSSARAVNPMHESLAHYYLREDPKKKGDQ